MARLKTFRTYLVLFLAFFLFTTFMINLATKNFNHNIENIEVLKESPVVTIYNCEAGKYSGYIDGIIKNNTGEHIEKLNIKLELYDKDLQYVGETNKEIKYFNVNEKTKFKITFKGENVNSIKIDIIY